MTSHQDGLLFTFPICNECWKHHNPENDCGFYDDYCDERYTIEGTDGDRYYVVTFADGSKIYVYRDQFACSHEWDEKSELGSACGKCTKHLFQHIEPIDQSLWLMYYSMKMSKEKEYDG